MYDPIAARAYRTKNRERLLAQKRAWYVKNRDQAREYDLTRQFGIDRETFQALLEQQAGLCRICCEAMRPGAGTHVDHSHSSGQVRGLLCQRCNHALGHLRDDPLLCEAARDYLLNQKGPNQ